MIHGSVLNGAERGNLRASPAKTGRVANRNGAVSGEEPTARQIMKRQWPVPVRSNGDMSLAGRNAVPIPDSETAIERAGGDLFHDFVIIGVAT